MAPMTLREIAIKYNKSFVRGILTLEECKFGMIAHGISESTADKILNSESQESETAAFESIVEL